MPDYHFVTEWDIPAPIDEVFPVIADSLSWPEWWRGVRSVQELAPGDANGIGLLLRFEWRSQLPYSLVFDMRSTLVEPPTRLSGTATGQLAGEGRWYLAPMPGGTHIRYEWDVRTTEWWMNLLAPIAQPFFVWNHDVVMGWGEEGLRRRLGLAPAGR
jgi:hypothetical protein